MSDQANLFDRSLVRQHRTRAANGFDAHDFLFREISERLVERLDDVLRDFPTVLDLGCHTGHLAQAIQKRPGVKQVTACDLSPAMVARGAGRDANTHFLAADEEYLPFGAGSFDLVVSCLGLHWTNDLPGALVQIRRSLKPGGLFLGAMLGGETLKELYQAFLITESEGNRGVSPRISPFAEVRDAGQLLQRAGFVEPVSDCDTLGVTYPTSLKLLTDLRGMGETNALHARRRSFTPRGTLHAMAKHYEARFPDTANTDTAGRNAASRIRASFQIVYLTGWVGGNPEDVA